MDSVIQIGACDDDRQTLAQIEELVRGYQPKKPLAMAVHIFGGAQDLLAYPAHLDLLYLDIELEGDSGIDLVPKIRLKYPEITIIFITSHWKYFIHSHRLGVFQFLTKPFDQVIFYEELDRFCQKYSLQKDLYTVNFQGQKIQFPICEILYIESALRHLRIFHMAVGMYEKFGQISHEETVLQPYGFIRCHHSYLVNAAHIEQIKNLKIVLPNPSGAEPILVPISKSRLVQVRRDYQDWLLERKE